MDVKFDTDGQVINTNTTGSDESFNTDLNENATQLDPILNEPVEQFESDFTETDTEIKAEFGEVHQIGGSGTVTSVNGILPDKNGNVEVEIPEAIDGKDGKDGKDGVSATHTWNGTVLTITSASGTSSADLKGEKGEQGIQGEKGEQGAKGDKGDTGAQGEQGIQGERGEKGEQGEPGATGAAGTNGKDGYTPVKGTDYWTDADIAEMQGYINDETKKVLPKLTTQMASIADLAPGVYFWDYDDVKTLDYYSGMKDIYQNPTLLQVTATEGQKDFFLFDDGYGADESRQEIIWGAIYINSETGTPDEGFCKSRFLYDIPSREDGFNVDTWGKPINFWGSSVGLYASQSDSFIEFFVGEGDETYITMSPIGIDVAANNGNLNLYAKDDVSFHSNEGNVNLYADSSIYLTAESGDIVFESSSFFKTTATFGSDVYFVGDATFNNGLTLNGALYLANNGQISDSENSLDIYKGTGSIWIGTENGGCIEITDDNLFVESYSNLNLVSNSNITFSSQNGSTYFSGNVDFTNATVTGLNVGGGGKTKITVAQLKSLMANYTANVGKLIQFVYKGNVFSERTITQAIGTVTIGNLNSISKTVGISSATSSALMGTNYGIYISSTEAYISIDSWDFDIANSVTNVNTGIKTNITDAKFDIYVMGE